VTVPLISIIEELAEEFGEGGMAVNVLDATDVMPAQLVVPFETDPASPHNLRIHCVLLPLGHDPAIMQFFVTLPYLVETSALATLARFVCAVNAELPLTGFEMNERHRVLVFRTTHPVDVDGLDPSVVAWTLSMVSSAIREFGPLVEDVAGGGDLALATDRLRDKLATIGAYDD
jgi:hypothetical protein